MRLWKITTARRFRQLFGVSQDWRTLPVSKRAGRDIDIHEPADCFCITLPIKGPWISKVEWDTLIEPYLFREGNNNVGI